MRKTWAIVAWVSCAIICGRRAQDGPYKHLKDIQIGGGGGWDYLNVDSAAKRLYVSHATKAVAGSTSRRTPWPARDYRHPGIHGAIPVPPDKIFTSNGRGNKASIVDAKTEDAEQGRHRGQPRFDPTSRSRKRCTRSTVAARPPPSLMPLAARSRATIPLGGKPEFAVVAHSAVRSS